jgi:hypothetical protein
VPTVDGFFPAIKLEMSRAGFQLAVLGRMLRSCLVGADCRDTEYHPVEGESGDRKWPALITIKLKKGAAVKFCDFFCPGDRQCALWLPAPPCGTRLA